MKIKGSSVRPEILAYLRGHPESPLPIGPRLQNDIYPDIVSPIDSKVAQRVYDAVHRGVISRCAEAQHSIDRSLTWNVKDLIRSLRERGTK